jgi:hypothetical protein
MNVFQHSAALLQQNEATGSPTTRSLEDQVFSTFYPEIMDHLI